MAELIVDSEYNAEELTAPLRGMHGPSRSHQEIDAALKKVEREPTEFTVYPLSDVKPASEALCQPPKDPEAVEEVAAAEKVEEEDEAEEEIAVTNSIQVAVPGRTTTPVVLTPTPGTGMATATATATATPGTGAEASDEEGEVEELRVVQFDGKVLESIKVE